MSAPHVFAVFSTKGGVGKTTTAVNLAWEAADEGHRVLLWDLDPQAASTWLLGAREKLRGGAEALIRGEKSARKSIRESEFERIDVLPADASYRDLDIALDASKKSSSRLEAALKPLRKEYDVIVLDCPPSSSRVAENALRAADVVVMPVLPAPLALRSLEQVRALMDDTGRTRRLFVFLNQVDRRKKAHREAVEQLPAADKAITDITVPATVVVERMGELRAPLGEFASRTAAAKAFGALWYEISRG